MKKDVLHVILPVILEIHQKRRSAGKLPVILEKHEKRRVTGNVTCNFGDTSKNKIKTVILPSLTLLLYTKLPFDFK